MAGEARNSDIIIRDAALSLNNQKAGGRRNSIGAGSARMKARHFGSKIKRIVLAVGAIIIAAMVTGFIIDGIGVAGVMLTAMAIMAAIAALSAFPKMKVPTRADLNTEDVRQLVGNTELWLEAQRPALPPPARKAIGLIGHQLDGLGIQLEEIDQKHPTAAQIRKLVGEDLPEMVAGYQKIPEHLRYEERTGSTPNAQLMEGLDLVSREIDSVTRQLAQGSLDDLAIRTRYLDYKYGGEKLDHTDKETTR